MDQKHTNTFCMKHFLRAAIYKYHNRAKCWYYIRQIYSTGNEGQKFSEAYYIL